MEFLELNWLWKQIKKVKNIQDSISINSCTMNWVKRSFSLHVSLTKIFTLSILLFNVATLTQTQKFRIMQLQDSSILLCSFQGSNFLSCNMQDRKFLSYSFQDTNLLSCKF